MTPDELNRAKETAGQLVHGVGKIELAKFCIGDDGCYFAPQDVCNGHFAAEFRQLGLKLVEEVERLRQAMPPADKLELLADWFDRHDDDAEYGGQREVQADLRKWAKAIRDV